MRDQYRTAPHAITCPRCRPRASRRGSAGRQTVFETPQTTARTITASPISHGSGFALASRSPVEPRATAPQKKSVAAVVGITPAAGTANVSARQLVAPT